jgi:hypothetical protein
MPLTIILSLEAKLVPSCKQSFVYEWCSVRVAEICRNPIKANYLPNEDCDWGFRSTVCRGSDCTLLAIAISTINQVNGLGTRHYRTAEPSAFAFQSA